MEIPGENPIVMFGTFSRISTQVHVYYLFPLHFGMCTPLMFNDSKYANILNVYTHVVGLLPITSGSGQSYPHLFWGIKYLRLVK